MHYFSLLSLFKFYVWHPLCQQWAHLTNPLPIMCIKTGSPRGQYCWTSSGNDRSFILVQRGSQIAIAAESRNNSFHKVFNVENDMVCALSPVFVVSYRYAKN